MLSRALYPKGAWAQFVQITDSPHYLVPRATVNCDFPKPDWSARGRGHRECGVGWRAAGAAWGPCPCGWRRLSLPVSFLATSAAPSHPGSCLTGLTITPYSFNKLSSVFALCPALQPMGWCWGWQGACSKCWDGNKRSRKQGAPSSQGTQEDSPGSTYLLRDLGGRAQGGQVWGGQRRGRSIPGWMKAEER